LGLHLVWPNVVKPGLGDRRNVYARALDTITNKHNEDCWSIERSDQCAARVTLGSPDVSFYPCFDPANPPPIMRIIDPHGVLAPASVKCLVSSALRVELPDPLAVKSAESVVRSVYRLTVGCQVLTDRQVHMRWFQTPSTLF